MKIAHISDIHWRGIARHEEYEDSFKRLFDLLKRRIQPDLIVNTGDTFHTKTQGITPEIIENLSWMFRSLADIAPTITILGNHDGNLTNSDRQDIISPIHEAINHPDAFLFKKSGPVSLSEIISSTNIGGIKTDDVCFHVYSPFDLDGWAEIKPIKNKINIGLFHGSIVGCETDSNFRMTDAERDVTFFKGMDFVLLGDIHRNQNLAHRLDKYGKNKPYISYPGSLIQQNFGEQENKGFLVWDIRSVKDWDVKFVELDNRAPFVTVPWAGTVPSTLKTIEKNRGDRAYIPGSRFRITSTQPIQQIEARQIFNELRDHRNASEVIFKYDLVSKMETIEAAGKRILKTSLRNDPDTLIRFYADYVKAYEETYKLTKEQKFQSEAIIRGYLHQLNSEDTDAVVRNVNWSLKNVEFDNIFRYGENNSVNFENLEGIVGIFGPNKIGKSSIVGAIMYGLFNTTDRGPMKNAHVINKNKKHCSAKILINVAGNDYYIERETVRNTPKRSSKKDEDKTATILNLYKIDANGNLQEQNSVTRDDTDKEIRKLIGMPQDFLLTAFSSQGGINRFIEEGATQRKAILSRFLDLDIFEKLHAYAKDDFAILNDKTKKYSGFDWGNALKRGTSEVSEIEKQVEEIQGEINANARRRDELRLWVMQHTNDQDGTSLKKFNEVKKSIEAHEKKVALLLREEESHDASVARVESKLSALQKKKVQFDTESLQDKLTKLESLRSEVSILRETLATETSTLGQQKKSVKKLETVPCGDQFPTCRFIKDSHEDKKKVNLQEKKVEALEGTVESMQCMVADLVKERIAEKLKDYDSLVKQEDILRNEFISMESSKELRKREISLAKSNLERFEVEYQEMATKLATVERKELEKNKLLLDVLTEDTEARERQHRDLLVKLGGKNEQLKQLTKERAECKTDLEKLKVYESIQQAFSKNGIPAMVLKTQLPAINFELTKILDNIVDFKVTLETDITSNVMDVYIEDGHSRRIIELASGMEKMICSLALRVALINLSSLSRPDILIIDEGFGALDEESTIKCMELLTVLKSYFKTVLVITHVNPIKEIADRIIEVKTDGIESKVEA